LLLVVFAAFSANVSVLHGLPRVPHPLTSPPVVATKTPAPSSAVRARHPVCETSLPVSGAVASSVLPESPTQATNDPVIIKPAATPAKIKLRE